MWIACAKLTRLDVLSTRNKASIKLKDKERGKTSLSNSYQMNSYQTTDNNMDMEGAKIKVIGVGGGGCNAVNRMIESNVQGIQFIAVNTDYQVLERSKANEILRIGEKVTRGLGAGMDRNKGASAANESRDEIAELLRGADMVFVTAGMGGGTGTGAAPIVAQIAKDMGILTVAVVTKPFGFEGASRRQNAEAGLAELEQSVDSLIVVPNDKLIEIGDDDMGFEEAFSFADQVLKYGVAGISDLITIPGLINLDLADIRRVMSNAGVCHMGIGRGSGPDRVNLAIEQAIHSPLLETSIDGAHRVIINYSGQGIKLKEISVATTMVRDAVAQDADIIFGAVPNQNLEDEIMITVIASGFDKPGSRNAEFSTGTGRRIDLGTGNAKAYTSRTTPLSPLSNSHPGFSQESSRSSYQEGFSRTNSYTGTSTESFKPSLSNLTSDLQWKPSAPSGPSLYANRTEVERKPAPSPAPEKKAESGGFMKWLSGDSDDQFEE